MFEFIKRWQERRRRESILRDIKKAKQIFLTDKGRFMCLCFKEVNYYKYISTEDIQKRIPEFNRKFCEATLNSPAWWPYVDRESRIKAFDKLIETYSK